MKWIEAKVVFESEDIEIAEDLIANIFYDFGLQGVVVEQPGLEPAEGWGDDAVEQPQHHSVSGFLPQNQLAQKRRQVLEDKLERIGLANHIKYRLFYNQIDEEDWAESWKEYFWPEKITDRIVVKPTWRTYDSDPNEIVIELDPGMAFGTGTHPTTSLCISMIEDYLQPGKSFLDVGTGSGILMVAAAKLGASKVWGIDIDEVAVEVAEKNLLQNRIEGSKFKVMTGNLVDLVDQRFDLVAANILSDVIITLLDSIKRVLAAGGTMICSGIIEAHKDDVLQKMKAVGLQPVDVRLKETWVAIAAK